MKRKILEQVGRGTGSRPHLRISQISRTAGVGLAPGNSKHFWLGVESGYSAVRRYLLDGGKRQCPCAAAHVENAHTRLKSGLVGNDPSEPAEKGRAAHWCYRDMFREHYADIRLREDLRKAR